MVNLKAFLNIDIGGGMKKAERSEALRHSEDNFAKQNLKCQKEEISKLTIALRDLETKTAKKSAAESKELNALLDNAKFELEVSCQALLQATDDHEDTETKLSRASQEIEDNEDKIKVISDQNKGLSRKINKLMQKIDQLHEEYELQLAFQHNLTLKKIKGRNGEPAVTNS